MSAPKIDPGKIIFQAADSIFGRMVLFNFAAFVGLVIGSSIRVSVAVTVTSIPNLIVASLAFLMFSVAGWMIAATLTAAFAYYLRYALGHRLVFVPLVGFGYVGLVCARALASAP